ncbi:Phosphoacetylglucosamine Mutase [Irineochytrium annulatum]|nr:Phosphoacetylglucosamine Mutase [Irineochytrium annulatum]
MVTASHNPAKDNGVKLVEPLGEMLTQKWEAYATALANAPDTESIENILNGIVADEKIVPSAPARIAIARDTRPSGEGLVRALTAGIHALGGVAIDFGLLTTPQLHYVTRCINTEGTPEAYGVPTESGYYLKLANAYKRIINGKPTPLKVDCANGIGALALERLSQFLGSTAISAFNTDIGSSEKLNHDCGADFVKIKQDKPTGLELNVGERACSLDGDADRLVYYYRAKNGEFKLLDGDKIATLAASFIMDLVQQSQVSIRGADGKPRPLNVGLVQTAYANGSSTAYVKETLKIPVVFTPTGVKHLHHEAERFDVGVYFEANGHGTVLFSTEAVKAFKETNGATSNAKASLEVLRALADLINQTVGDALSDMLLVEAILACQGKTLESWDADYTDLPSRQEKVKV